MKDVYAFITGIEKYEHNKWSVAGPARTAVDMARWVLDLGALPAHIHVFVAVASEKHEPAAALALRDDLDALKAKGVVVSEAATRHLLYDFWRTTLLEMGPGRLFAYWSGHGGLNASDRRLFYCADCTPAKMGNVLDWTKVLESLRSPSAKGIATQFALADVCGVLVPFSSPDNDVWGQRKVDQTNFYATADGEYAEGMVVGGNFSRRALAVLKALNAWPDPMAFWDEIVKDNPTQPFLLDARGRTFAFPPRVVGTPRAIPAIAGSAVSLLQQQPRSESAYRLLYERTVEPLRSTGLWQPRTLPSMLAELSKLGCDHDEALPRPLIEFLLRAGLQCNLLPAVREWCKAQGVLDTTLQTIEEKLEQETLRHYLLIELEEDADGKLTAISPVLYNHDLTLRIRSWGSISIGSHKELCSQLPQVIDDARAHVGVAPLEVQFLTNPVLLGRALHAIEVQRGRLLGEVAPVVVRWRERVRRPQNCSPELWKKFEDIIRAAGPRKMLITPLRAFNKRAIDEGRLAEEVKKRRGSFVLSSPDPRVIAEALKLGAPFLCWTDDKTIEDKDVVGALRRWTQRHDTLDRTPDALHEARQERDKIARSATLLWDNPRLLPDAKQQAPAGVRRLSLPGRE